jgi:hypothetical protein
MLHNINFPQTFRPIQEIPCKTPEWQAQNDKIYVAMPCGKRSYLWFSNDGEEDGCFLIYPSSVQSQSHTHNNVQIQPQKIKIDVKDRELYYGTLIIGNLVYPPGSSKENEYFVADDLLYYKGICIKSFSFSNRLEYLVSFLHSVTTDQINNKTIVLANMYSLGDVFNKPKYVIHHWQKRSFSEEMHYESLKEAPRFNLLKNSNTFSNNLSNPKKNPSETTNNEIVKRNTKIVSREIFHLPIYNEKVTFKVIPEDQCDVYTLYAFSVNNEWVCYGHAGIFSFETSQLLNHCFFDSFPKCLDDIEESDDEDEDEDEKVQETVKNKKELFFECCFSFKFRKWIPLSLSSFDRVVSIHSFQK